MESNSKNGKYHGLAAAVGSRILADLPIYALTLPIFALFVYLLHSKGIVFRLSTISTNAQIYLGTCQGMLAADCLYTLVRHRPKRPFAHLRQRYLARQRLETGLQQVPIIAVLIVFLPFFSAMKSAIPLFNIYSWDRTFIEIDRALFLGHDPWQLLQPVLGYPIITAALALFYHLWFLLIYFGSLCFLFLPIDNAIRRRFVLTFLLTWAIVGGAMATALASYGPCFVKPLLGYTDFDAQMSYLYAANQVYTVMTLPVQQMLLERLQTSSNGLGSGITAMPSMHIAIAFIFYLASRKLSAQWGNAFLAFFILIWIASVHLAYHYAIDGLVSVLAVGAIWKASGWLFTWWDALLDASRHGHKTLRVPYPTFRTKTVPAE